MSWLSDFWHKIFPKKEEPSPSHPPPHTLPPWEEQPSAPVPPAADTLYSDNSGKFLINGKVLELTKHFEGLVLEAEDDGYGTPTIGYGRIKYPDGRKVRNGDLCTKEEAEAWLLHDLYDEGAKYVRALLRDDVEDALTPDQFSVFVDLCFNRGCGRFRENMAALLNAGKMATAITQVSDCKEFHYIKGSYNLGLHRRRWAERLILEGDDWHKVDTVEKFKAFKKARGI